MVASANQPRKSRVELPSSQVFIKRPSPNFPESKRVRAARHMEGVPASTKYNFTAEESHTYSGFVKFLANFEVDEMYEILTDLLKDARSK